MSSGLKIKSAWKVKKEDSDQPVTSLIEIMNVELAEQLEEEDAHGIDPSIAQYGLSATELVDCTDDLALARKLQEEFDREYENSIKANEEKSEKKIELTFERYHPAYGSDYELDDSSDIGDDVREKATDLLYSKPVDDFPTCGYMRDASGTLITKHNKEVNERKNTDKVLQLPIEFPTGDVIGEKLNNQVYNKLRNYSKVEQRRHVRLKDKDEKAASELSVDKSTRLILYKWINSGTFDQIENTIATGKESVVLHAVRHADETNGITERHFAIKVYKMNLAEFKNRSEYVQNDYRFKNPRRVLRVWAEKELMNLKRMTKCSMKCPEPIQRKKHVLLMSLIGQNGAAAPQLKDIEWLDQESKFDAFMQVKEAMLCLYKNCLLVHGDLSEFNILYLDNVVHFIDVAQAIDLSHPRCLFFLLRDIENILAYFEKVGTENLPKTVDLFNEITGLNMDPEKNLLVQVEHFEKDNRNIQLRLDKAKPADMELRLYNADVALTHEDPAKLYN